MSIYQFANVSVSYDSEILSSLDFSVERGEIVGILGPNGSGKTTLLKLMAGVLSSRTGSIQLLGRNIVDYSRLQIARLVSVLPQDTLVDFPFTSLEIVLMGRAPYLGTFQWETPEDLRIAQEAMRLADCAQFAERDVRSLSGGERARVMLARALAQQPSVLLLDEPTTHLDLKHWLDIYRLLKKLKTERDLTIIVVLHDLNFASLACDRVLLLAEKRIQAYGPPQKILRPELLEKVYGTAMAIGTYLDSGQPIFLPRLN